MARDQPIPKEVSSQPEGYGISVGRSGVHELFPTIIKIIIFIVVMDFSTAVTLDSFFLTLGGVLILFSLEDNVALWLLERQATS